MKVIAELGSNFKSFDDCKNAISIAKQLKADAIKFQLYTHSELYGVPGILPGVIPKEWIPKLKEKAEACGIEFMCTAFSPQGVKFIDDFVDTHKLASSEMCHRGMLDVLRETHKPVYISTGAQTENDICTVNRYMAGCPITFLYCEAVYPSHKSDLRRILRLREITNRDVGFSDHTTDIYNLPRIAQDMWCDVLEKHFNPFDYTDTPDAPHSLNTEDFQSMIRCLQESQGFTQIMMGPTKDELPMILRHKRRIIATTEIKVGDQLRLGENCGIFRSKKSDVTAQHPFTTQLGLATRDYVPGDGI